MKLLLIGLFCFMFYDAMGQAHGRILVVPNATSGFGQKSMDSLPSFLSLYYKGEIVVRTELIDSLESFDAVFIGRTSSAKQDSFLIEYLRNGGNLYMEGWGVGETPEFDSLIGVSELFFHHTYIRINTVRGVPGSFTEGIKQSVYHKDPLEYDAGGGLGVVGECDPVLDGIGTLGNTVAWQYDTLNYKVVLHWHLVSEHYREFLGRVICNYFGLCEPLNVKEPDDHITDVPISYDLINNRLLIHNADKFSTIELYNTLGVKFFERRSSTDIKLPASLASGNYFVVARGAGSIVTKTIIISK
jgi:hypothetical protein